MEDMMNEIVERLETNRINVDLECAYRDPTGSLRREYERANDMLDDCIESVKTYFRNRNKQ